MGTIRVPHSKIQTVFGTLFYNKSMFPLIAFSCSAPIEAPKDFEQLLSYIYARTMDKDVDELTAGAENMQEFAGSNQSDLQEGYTISPLTDVSIETTGTTPRATDEQYGVALMYSVPYGTRDVTLVNTIEDLEMVYLDDYISYDREYHSDQHCFVERSCSTVRFRSTIQSSLPFGAEMTSSYINEIRWLELDSGLAAVQRSWLDGDAVSTAEWVNMEAQYYLGITYQTETGSDTVAASWAAIMVGDLPLPEDTAKNQALDALRKNGEDLTRFLDENGGY